MGLSNFLSKAGAAASQVLQGYTKELFEEILLRQHVCLAFDEQAATSKEGLQTLDLTVRLLARLYPCLELVPLSSNLDSVKSTLEALAQSINPQVAFGNSGTVTVCIVVGKTKVSYNVPTFYLGSDNWITKFSDSEPVLSGGSDNSLAAGAAACIGAANVFRYVFKDYLPNSSLDTTLSMSLVDYRLNAADPVNPDVRKINIGNVHLVGLGAVGNGFVWALRKSPYLEGNVTGVDGESIDLSNLQRYILTDQDSVDCKKTEVVKNSFCSTGLNIAYHPEHWGEYLEQCCDLTLDTVAVGVDSAKDRILVQASLPKIIFNAWTQTNDLGVSRHIDFIKEPCLACMYLPTEEKQSQSQEIAQNLGLIDVEGEGLIRQYLALNLPVDQVLIERIASAKGISVELLKPYIGYQVQAFYSQVVCGGMLMSFSNDTTAPNNVEVPLAFQSAMAGIMLAAEVIVHAGDSALIQLVRVLASIC
ncbi:E2 ligase fold family C protein [Pontibacter rugosus]